MGYTHYMRGTRGPNITEWDNITTTFRTMLRKSPQPIQYECDVRKPPAINKDQIRFNGIENDGHETMLVNRRGDDFNFCKTARKPYDRVVVALLLLMNHFAPGSWEISSDGTPADWQKGLKWARDTTGLDLKLPKGVK